MMIEIKDLHQKTLKDIIELLEKEELPFKVSIPKQTALFNSTSQDIAHDYARLAFSGQLLNEIALKYNQINMRVFFSLLQQINWRNWQK